MKKITEAMPLLKQTLLSAILIIATYISHSQTQGLTDTVLASASGTYGYYASRPLNYDVDTTKKFPLLISLHGSGEQGNGTTELYKVLGGGGTTIPQRLKTSSFPASFEVDGDSHSFIVVCPQFKTAFGLTNFLTHLKSKFRIDTTRVYMTGLSLGGGTIWNSNAIIADRLAAITLVAPSLNSDRVALGAEEVNIVNSSNLPVWATYNYNEGPSIKTNVTNLINNLNATVPEPIPLAKKIVQPSNYTDSHDAWTQTYNPNYIFDSTNWLNVYQWMLQYTNKKLVAKAGRDTIITLPVDSIRLNGSKSTVRQGRIDSLRWSQVSGPSTFTITSPASLVTSVTGLVAGAYQFELKVYNNQAAISAADTITVTVYSDSSNVGDDTVTTQTQTKITQNVTSNIHGYLQSLPVNYNEDSTRKFPLIISLHGAEAVGSGSSTALDTVAMQGIPKLIRDGQFPSAFTLNNGKSYSFIVVSPQFTTSYPSYSHTQLNTFINHLKSALRVDAERVYVAGLGTGGGLGYLFVVGGTATSNAGYVDSITALVGAGSDVPGMNSVRLSRIVQSNLPYWLTHNTGDPVISSSKSSYNVNEYNTQAPIPSPLAQLTLFNSSSQDSWTTTYDPNYILDSANNYNVYKWMLQYTNKKLVANAGKDITMALPKEDTVLNGSQSTVREGRINTVIWNKISGPSTYTIVSPDSLVTGITGLIAGTYQFQLQLTHTDSTTAKDTVTIIVNDTITPQTQTKVTQNVTSNIHGYLQSLPVNYNEDSTRKFPLIISLHGADAVGSGSSTALDTVAMQGIPKLIRDGQFPSAFTLNNGKSYSFIVVSPQFTTSYPSYSHTQLNTFINHLKSALRVDAERVYVAGLGTGGGLGYLFAVGGTATSNAGYVDSITALVGAGSDVPGMNSVRLSRIVQSNLPYWLTHNTGDPVISSSKSSYNVNEYNTQAPIPSPLAQLTLFNSSSQDSWTTTYDPNYILDSANNYNLYKWMLQYTNKKLVANAGNDKSISTSTSTLDGSKSTARRGRITKYAWTKISGGSVTVASDTNAVTGISGLSNGTYQFQLQITHTDSTTAKDTVTITVSGVSPRVAAPVVEVAQPAMQTDELLSAKINPTVAQSQVTVVITGRATGKANLQISSMDGKRLHRQSFVKDGTTTTRTVNVSSMPAGTYIVEIIVGGKHRKILRFVKQ